jgi:hypothetical protein
MNENLLLHILTGEATSKEKEEFYRQLGDNKKEEELFYEVKSLWLRASMHHTKVDADLEFEDLWRRIKHGKKETSWPVGILNTLIPEYKNIPLPGGVLVLSSFPTVQKCG